MSLNVKFTDSTDAFHFELLNQVTELLIEPLSLHDESITERDWTGEDKQYVFHLR